MSRERLFALADRIVADLSATEAVTGRGLADDKVSIALAPRTAGTELALDVGDPGVCRARNFAQSARGLAPRLS